MAAKSEKFKAGIKPDPGIYKCLACGKEVEIKDGEELIACSKCRHKTFVKLP